MIAHTQNVLPVETRHVMLPIQPIVNVVEGPHKLLFNHWPEILFLNPFVVKAKPAALSHVRAC